MKSLNLIVAIMLFAGTVIASPDRGEHKAQGSKPQMLSDYDYHDYVNSNIRTKTFNRYNTITGSVNDKEAWSFARPVPGEVIRTEISTDDSGNAYRCLVNVFNATAEAFVWKQNSTCDASYSPPMITATASYDPAVVTLTDAMARGIDWGSAGARNITDYVFGYENTDYFTDVNRLLGVEDVTVPAGSYRDCLKIYRERKYGNSPLRVRMDWICPNTGLVKRIHEGTILLELTDVTFNDPED